MSSENNPTKIYTADPLAAIKELDEKLDKCMATFEARMATASSSSMEQLAADVKQFKVCMKLAMELVRSQITHVMSLVDDAKNRSRRKFLLFRGVEETDKENLKCIIAHIVVDKLKIKDFTPEAIRFCYRLGKNVSRTGVRPVLVRFQSLDTRSQIWRKKKELKGSTVSIAEYLTASRRSIFNEGRKSYGVDKCWSQDGNGYLLAPDGIKHRIVSHAQIQEIVMKFPPPTKEKEAAGLADGKATSSTPTKRSARTGRFIKPKK